MERRGFAQKLPRLCRLMCGRPLAFRQDCLLDFGLRPICWAKPQIHCEPERKRRALPHIRRQSRWRESLFRQSLTPYLLDIRLTNGECSVTALPRKVLQLRKHIMHPSVESRLVLGCDECRSFLEKIM